MKCWVCGAEATKCYRKGNPYAFVAKKELSKFQRCYCDECFDKVAKEMEEENAIFIKLKRKRMIETAIYKLESQSLVFEDYKEAIDAVVEYNEEHPDKFDSAGEVIAAIMLIKDHIKIKPQYKIDKYQVDFLLPEEKIVLEIDGDIHRVHRAKDSIRDEVIRHQLGEEWQIVRIPASELYQNAKKLVKAIDAVIDYRYDYASKWLK